MAQAKTKFVVEIIPIAGAGYHQERWRIHIRGGESDYSQAWNLAEAFRCGRTLAAFLIAKGAHIVQVYKRDKEGKWREERTYPRSADPRSSKG